MARVGLYNLVAKGGFVMKREYLPFDRLFHLGVLLLFTLVFFSSVSRADDQLGGGLSKELVSLTGAVAPAASTNLSLVGGSTPFIVPSKTALVLTDIVISPQSFPPAGNYLWQVLPSPNFFTTALTVTSTAIDPSSFQVHLTTGMLFQAGSDVEVDLVFGNSGVNVSAFGYLTRAAH
jgi:hypothetical protein